MTKPEVRARLLELARGLRDGSVSTKEAAAALEYLELELYSRSPNRRAPTQSDRMTPALREAIRQTIIDRPDLTYAQIGTQFNVNPGRVSEIGAGFRS